MGVQSTPTMQTSGKLGGMEEGGALATRCVSCGAEQPGDFCPACGERRITAADRSIAAFLRRALEEVTDVDSRLIRTLRRLVFSPGYLTQAFADGARKPYLGPVQLFLLANLAYFLLQPFSTFSAYNVSLENQRSRQAYSTVLPVAEWADAAATNAGLDAATFETVFNNQSELLARSLVFFMVPVFAVFMSLFMLDRGRPFVDHLVFSLHFFAFDLLVLHCAVLMVWPHLVIPVTNLIPGAAAGSGLPALLASVILELGASLLVTVPYLNFAYRRFYGLRRWRALPTAFASLIALFVTILSYRLLLLLVTLATV